MERSLLARPSLSVIAARARERAISVLSRSTSRRATIHRERSGRPTFYNFNGRSIGSPSSPSRYRVVAKRRGAWWPRISQLFRGETESCFVFDRSRANHDSERCTRKTFIVSKRDRRFKDRSRFAISVVARAMNRVEETRRFSPRVRKLFFSRRKRKDSLFLSDPAYLSNL